MASDALREEVEREMHDKARCPVNDDLLHADKAISVAVALIERKVAEERARWGHAANCDCHKLRMPGFVGFMCCTKPPLDHPVRDPRCAPPPDADAGKETR